MSTAPMTSTEISIALREVHLAVKHARTGRIGCCYSPTEEVSTACRASWPRRPRRSRRAELVTCRECLASLVRGATPDEKRGSDG